LLERAHGNQLSAGGRSHLTARRRQMRFTGVLFRPRGSKQQRGPGEPAGSAPRL